MLELSSPSELRLHGYDSRLPELQKALSYVDRKVDYELRKLKDATWFVRKYGEEALKEKLAELKAQRDKSLLFHDDSGYWTYSGLAGKLADSLDDEVSTTFTRPEAKVIPWAKVPEHPLRYYQTEALEALLEAGHGAVSIGTGLGKTRIFMEVLKVLGMKSVILCPFDNIAKQAYDELVLHFGKKYVGFVGDGKKEYNKLFVVGIGASLKNLKPGSLGWEHLSKAQVFIADESHMCPAKTLSEVCFGLMKDAPYRFFFSGTQIRSDGLDLLLDAIIGPIVYTMTVREGVDQGFLAKPTFRMLKVHSGVVFESYDANELTRAHLFYSPKVVGIAADMANKAVASLGRPTVILVEEIEQFAKLLPHLRYEARFAHGPLSKEQKELLPEAYHASDPKALVKAFNEGEFPILVGTSCITTGTDIKAVKCILFLRGGKSEVEVKQAVGRGTRRVPGKNDCIFIDIAIENEEMLSRHANARREYYEDIYPSYQELSL